MLDRPIPLSRPRAPSRKSISNHLNRSSNSRSRKSFSDSNPISSLTDSPLSSVVRLLGDRLPNVSIDSNPCGSLEDAFSPQLTLNDLNHQLDSNIEFDQLEISEQEPSAISLEWISHKTREELESLLIAADRVIRERERDLGIAASIGKSLLENNIALRARQEKLLEQSSPLPSTPNAQRAANFNTLNNSSSRSEYIEARPPPSPLYPDDSRFELDNTTPQAKLNFSASPISTHKRVDSMFSNTSQENFTPSAQKCTLPPVLRSAHSSLSSASSTSVAIPLNHVHRTPSTASSAALHRLAQQNEYLAERLAELEAETAESEIQGRKRLRKLVKELDSLRADLRQTEERNAVLEEERLNNNHNHRQSNLTGVESMVDEIVGGMKRVIMEDDDEVSDQAPPRRKIPQNSRKITPTFIPIFDRPAANVTSEPIADSPQNLYSRANSRSSSVSNLSFSNDLEKTINPAERALVSQLMIKISELKDGQEQFEQEREQMKQRLIAAQEEVDSMRLLVEEAEGELIHYKQLSLDDTPAPGLIGWESGDVDDENDEKLESRAKGNRRMIERRRRKSSRKKHWPAAAHQSFNLKGETTPEVETDSMRPTDFQHYFGQEPESPCLRGRPLSFTLSNRSMTEDEQDQQTRVLRAVGAITASPSLKSVVGDDAISDMDEVSESPLKFLSKDLNEHKNEDEETQSVFDTERSCTGQASLTQETLSENSLRAPNSARSSQQSYAELQRAVAELPVIWADDDDEEGALKRDDFKSSASVTRKRDSTGWLYEHAADYNQFEAWSTSPTSHRATLSVMPDGRFKSGVQESPTGMTINPLKNFGKTERAYSEEEEGEEEEEEEEEEERSSTVSSSTTTVGNENSLSDSGTSRQNQASRQQVIMSRREQALRRLGIPVDTSDSSNSTNNRAAQLATELEEEEEEEEVLNDNDEEDEEDWKYIDSMDHDNKPQGSRGTDYYPVSTIKRNAPGMVIQRVKVESSQMKVFVSEWAKLVTVVGFAVGWALWQGPGGVTDKSFESEEILKKSNLNSRSIRQQDYDRVDLRRRSLGRSGRGLKGTEEIDEVIEVGEEEIKKD
ncbi:hypothetical protein PPACK8108_LOCUS22237 [Phakopsora pachyrhizi]|uniref:Uncharacterized protein n=1 Tax=Phakopsora pachyrhizi TaxID=170000 RepID=A0AAV0BN75_PHAPC|nr:hypothetical protein PPACK8108_LOCUS22237 [Phakopsora pachyrhizi]